MANDEISPNSNSPKKLPFKLDDRQEIIYERLNRLVGPGAAAFYKDACRHLVIDPSFVAVTHIVAHLLREIESALRDVLESVTGPTQEKEGLKEEEKHRQEIELILKALGFNESDLISKVWLELPGKNGLQRYAHRNNLEAARPLDQVFLELWSRMQIILGNVLDRFETQYTKVFASIDVLVQKANPTESDAKIIKSNIPNNFVAHQKFFSQLENPKWLPLLKEKEMFLDPPLAEQNPEEGTVRHMPWAATVYLEKMATINPSLVAEVLREIKDTDNSTVRSSLLRIASLLPSSERETVSDKIRKWLKVDHQFFQSTLLEPSTILMNKFIEDGKEDKAFEIAKTLLEILPNSSPITTDEYISLRDPKTRLDHWHYNEFLEKEFQTLIQLNPKYSFSLVSELLSEYFKLRREARQDNIDNYEDLSYISRPAIEDHDQNRDRENIEDALITAIRDIGLKMIQENPTIVEDLIEELESKKWTVFRRIALYLLSEYPEKSIKWLNKYLLDLTLFDSSDVKHEYARLMNKGFHLLSREQKEKILDWIDKAKVITEHIEEQNRENPIEADRARKFKEVWQKDRLSHIKDDLTDIWGTRYIDFISKYGEPEHPDFAAYRTEWIGPTSEFKAEDLINMDVDKMIHILKTWEPKEDSDGFGATKEGLGRELGVAIKSKPDYFVIIAEKFKELDPTYVRTYIQTFSEIIQNDYKLYWLPVLELALWVVRQPREILGRKGTVMDQDPDWSWTRKAIASLISRGANDNQIPYELRDKVWQILKEITLDPDPTPDDEIKREENTDDAYHLAINTTRGEAMNAVIEYALWVYRYVKDQPNGEEKIKEGFLLMPEVRETLEWHLDPQNDPSIAVRSVYARSFPWLLLLDRKWTLDHINKIFPIKQPEDRLYKGAWNTFMLYTPAYNDPFKLLQEQYMEAVKNLGKVDKKRKRFTDRDERLAEHLMLFYGRGQISLSDSLFKEFWDAANDDLRGHALGFIGRLLQNKEGDFDPSTLERLKLLWENRLEIVKSSVDKSEHEKEMSAFGWWFSSDRFDPKWTSNQYLEALEIGRETQSDYFVFKRLV